MPEKNIDDQAIFEIARRIDSHEARQAYLQQICGEDSALEQRIAALLRAYEENASFLESPPPELATSPTLDRPITEMPGTQIGPYKLLQEIGQGGMGVVYMAEQKEPVERRVALKIIKPGMDTRQVIARFEAERQALAMMDHPNIAKVFGAGTTDSGRPYFVMELVNGIPVTQFCDEQRLTARERLELFIPICQAVQHAHQKGIIHRDIKPSNILVALYDGRPVPKVIDFGVAKATGGRLTEKTMFTGLGQIVGTIEYMSPEQAQRNQLDIDTRSDVYALGVVLYELLTGDTPFDKQRLRSAAFDEMLKIIREEEPPRPSTKLSSSDTLPSVAANRKTEPAKLSALVRGDLDWIVMKALEKDRARRYETASSLAADLQHYLNDEPVLACPPSAAYRLGKFARRNKAMLTTFVLVALALVTGAGISIWQAWRAHEANRRTLVALAQKNAEYQRAETNLHHALAAIDQLLGEVGHRDLASAPHMEHVRRRLLEKAQDFFETLLATRTADPAVRLEVGMTHYKLGDVHALLGDHVTADQEFASSTRILSELLATAPQSGEYRRGLGRAQYRRAMLWKESGRLAEALPLLQQARLLQQQLTALTAAAEDWNDLSQTNNLLGIIQEDQGQLAQAEQHFRSAVHTAQLLVEQFPEDSEHFKSLIKCLGNLAGCLQEAGLVDQGDHQQQRAFDVIDRARQRFPDDPEIKSQELIMACNAAINARAQRAFADAEAFCVRGVQAGEQLADQYPDVPDYRLRLSATLGVWGELSRDAGRLDEADARLTRAIQLAEQIATSHAKNPSYRSNLGGLLHNRSLVREKRGDMRIAKDDIELAMQAQRAAVQLNPRARVYREFLCNHANNLARILRELGSSMDVVASAYEQAVTEARDLIRDFPEVPAYRIQLLVALYSYAVTVADNNPEQAMGLLLEATETHATGRQDEALDATTLFHLYHAYALLVQIMEQQGDTRLTNACDQWVRVAQSFAESSVQRSDWQALIAAVEGRMKIRGQQDGVDCLRMACAFARLGQLDVARQWLEKADDDRPSEDPEVLRLGRKVSDLLTDDASADHRVTGKDN